MPSSNTFCFFNTVMEWGGGEKWHLEAAQLLHTQGHQVILYTAHDSVIGHRAKSLGIRVREVRIGKYSYLNPFAVKKLRQAFVDDNINTLILNLSSDMKVGSLAANGSQVNRVIYRRGSAIPIKNSWVNRKLLGKYVDEILANSQATKQTLFEQNDQIFDQSKVKVIYNPVELPAESEVSRKPVEGRLVIGNVGRLFRQKGQHHLIALAIILRDRKVNFVIKIAGEGREREKLKQAIASHNLTDHLVLLGFIEDLSEFYQSIDVFALTSLWEGFGYVIAEAMSYGVPAVGFDVSSNPELIKHDYNGKLVKVGEMEAFAEAILTIASDGQRYSQAARAYVETHFAQDKINAEIVRYLVG